ncbi:MAG TPA: sigma-70 family RNA polymerase sigma factor [Pirellulales bacterium]|nr:sigma-70 family RNA polymerase sigma factor [Pirellulales bacterium]
MPGFPTTRHSLLVRLRDSANHEAWEEFVLVYSPAIYRFARKRGLQHADAQDLAQTVLSAVAQRVANWKPDADRARFRTWLARIASNQTITMFRRHKPDAARGGTTAVAVLNEQQAPATDLELNCRREAFRALARKVRAEFEEATWQAFWMTAVEGVSVEEAACSLGRSAGAIYTARSRIIRRLQELAKSEDDEFLADAPESEGPESEGPDA